LDHGIHRAAQVAREAAENQPQHEREHDADESDGGGNLRADERPGKEVAPGLVGAEEVDPVDTAARPRLVLDAEEVNVRLEKPENLVRRALHKEPDILPAFSVLGIHREKGHGIVARHDLVHERAQGKVPLGVHKVNAHGLHVGDLGVIILLAVGREEAREDGDQVDDAQCY
jgi:hypothetical protein